MAAYNTAIDNTEDLIDSRDVIARIEWLEDLGEEGCDDEERTELANLRKLQSLAERHSDWAHGATLIRATYFVEYTKSLIADTCELPKEFTSDKWPYRHMTFDYEAAAEELKVDYSEVNFAGEAYYIRD